MGGSSQAVIWLDYLKYGVQRKWVNESVLLKDSLFKTILQNSTVLGRKLAGEILAYRVETMRKF